MTEARELIQLREENRRLKADLQKAYKDRAELHNRLVKLTQANRECGKPPQPPVPTPNHQPYPGND